MNTNGTANKACLTDENLYSYLTQNGSGWRTPQLEAHLAGCSKCRKALADLIELLHPEDIQGSEPVSQPTASELQQTVQLVQNVARSEQKKKTGIPAWVRWPIAAAAAIGIISASLLVFRHFSDRSRSEEFFAEAKKIIDQSYMDSSRSKLRLALPFSAESGMRAADQQGSLRSAENRLYQALAIQENMVEARLGLGYIYLSGTEYGKARGEFESILKIQKDDKQALIGRGVAWYEEAQQSNDPLDRINQLKAAQADFERVLAFDPNSVEARYDKIMVLFGSGLHQEALKEIELYLKQDPNSAWAEELKTLKTRMQMSRSSVFREEMDHAARLREAAAISDLARLLPDKTVGAIITSMRRSLGRESEKDSDLSEPPSADDLVWAAKAMEASYSEATGDHSLKNLIQFYVGLSPPERRFKRELDDEFQKLNKLQQNHRLCDRILTRSKYLEAQYTQLKDYWKLADLHHLRANILYTCKAEFQASEREFFEMLTVAKNLDAPEPTARALAGLAIIMGQERKFGESLTYARKLKNIADQYHLNEWPLYVAMTRGNQYRRMGRLDLALKEYSFAMGAAAHIGETIKLAEALENAGLVMEQQERFLDAGAFYAQAVRLQDEWIADDPARVQEMSVRHVNLLLRQGNLAMRLGDLDKAENAFSESLATAQAGMKEAESRALVAVAEIYLSKKRFPEAKDLLNRAIRISQSGRYLDTEWEAKFLKGRVLEYTNQPKAAHSLYVQSISILERMRQKVPRGDLKHSFYNNRYDPFKAVVSLLFRRGDKEKALEFVDRAKAATLRDDLTVATLSAKSRRKLVAGPSPMIEYFFVDEGLLVFYIGQGRLEASLQKLTRDEISQQVRSFVLSIQHNNLGRFAELAGKLYQELILPIEKHLDGQGTETLAILPDGPLHTLPFAGLMDANRRHLIERMPIAYAPSQTVYSYCLNHRMASSNSVVMIDGTQGLPFAREELAYLSKLFGKNARSVSANDWPALVRETENSAIVHFSGHSLKPEGKPVLVLQTIPQKIYLDSQTISGWKCAANRLVNLAGCETATGPVAEGEGPWGLIPAFLNAGAPSVIASLLPVDDEATRKLDCQFYEMLRQGAGKAKALQTAQLTLLAAARKHSAGGPQSWVPYILVGNPQ